MNTFPKASGRSAGCSLLVLLVFFATISAEKALACECPPVTDLNKKLQQATISFVGRVDSAEKTPLKPGELQVRFAVHRRFKGFEEVPMDRITIYTPIDEGACGYRFTPGLDYLVFGEGNPAHFMTTKCLGTDLLDNATLEVQRLMRLTNQKE